MPPSESDCCVVARESEYHKGSQEDGSWFATDPQNGSTDAPAAVGRVGLPAGNIQWSIAMVLTDSAFTQAASFLTSDARTGDAFRPHTGAG